MEGQRFCGSEDVKPEMLKDEAEVNFTAFKHFSLFNVLLQVEPAVPFLIEQLSKALHIEDKGEALKTFRQILSFLELPRKNPPETVRS